MNQKPIGEWGDGTTEEIPCPKKHASDGWCLDCRYAKETIEYPGNAFVKRGSFCSYPYGVQDG